VRSHKRKREDHIKEEGRVDKEKEAEMRIKIIEN
jgi:hypothetical protein